MLKDFTFSCNNTILIGGLILRSQIDPLFFITSYFHMVLSLKRITYIPSTQPIDLFHQNLLYSYASKSFIHRQLYMTLFRFLICFAYLAKTIIFKGDLTVWENEGSHFQHYIKDFIVCVYCGCPADLCQISSIFSIGKCFFLKHRILNYFLSSNFLKLHREILSRFLHMDGNTYICMIPFISFFSVIDF